MRVRVPAGEPVEIADHQDALLVPLTADLEGRRPPADVAWQPAGTTVFENRAA